MDHVDCNHSAFSHLDKAADGLFKGWGGVAAWGLGRPGGRGRVQRGLGGLGGDVGGGRGERGRQAF